MNGNIHLSNSLESDGFGKTQTVTKESAPESNASLLSKSQSTPVLVTRVHSVSKEDGQQMSSRLSDISCQSSTSGVSSTSNVSNVLTNNKLNNDNKLSKKNRKSSSDKTNSLTLSLKKLLKLERK